jgi:phosphoglycerate dehydrogenase-like enzyme
MLFVARGLLALQANQREHLWKPVPQFEMHSKTVVIIGLGPIGRGTAMRAKAFGMHTLGLRRQNSPVESVDEDLVGTEGLHKLLVESDFMVLAAALTGETRALIGAEQIALLKPTVWLINIARGGLIDEPALIAALSDGTLGGACLDVFAQEPLPPDNPLWDLPNVYLAPHNSPGGDPNLQLRQKAIFVENLRRFACGAPLKNVVDKTREY